VYVAICMICSVLELARDAPAGGGLGYVVPFAVFFASMRAIVAVTQILANAAMLAFAGFYFAIAFEPHSSTMLPSSKVIVVVSASQFCPSSTPCAASPNGQ
jgi:hypothetical protein